MNVNFRVDASVTIGTGHVMRCLTLAIALLERGAECQFVTRDLPGNLSNFILESGFPVLLLDQPSGPEPHGPPVHASWAGLSWEKDVEETRSLIESADWLVVDHYSFDMRWHRAFGDLASRILVIDDLADRRLEADLLLDQNLGRQRRDYDELVPEHCSRLIGPSYALLRPQFAQLRGTSLARRKTDRPSKILVTMGGVDRADSTSQVLRGVEMMDLPDDVSFTVVMGSNAPFLERVSEIVASFPWEAKMLIDVSEMAELMTQADIAIGAGGSTTWERCCLGLPGVIIETAKNQAGAVAAMQKSGAALGVGPLDSPEFNSRLSHAISKLMDPIVNARCSASAAELCFGDGASKVARIMVACL